MIVYEGTDRLHEAALTVEIAKEGHGIPARNVVVLWTTRGKCAYLSPEHFREMVSKVEAKLLEEVKNAVYVFLRRQDRGVSFSEILAAVAGPHSNDVEAALSVLHKEGRVSLCSPGVFFARGYEEADRLRDLESSANHGSDA